MRVLSVRVVILSGSLQVEEEVVEKMRESASLVRVGGRTQWTTTLT